MRTIFDDPDLLAGWIDTQAKPLEHVIEQRVAPWTNCGTIYRLRTDVAGLPLAPCRVRIAG